MTVENAWKQFEETGSVAAYIQFRALAQGGEGAPEGVDHLAYEHRRSGSGQNRIRRG